MAAGEYLTKSRFYYNIEGLDDLVVKSVNGIGINLEVAGDMKPYGVSKNSATSMQATVSTVSQTTVTVEYVGSAGDDRLMKWYKECHPEGMVGKATDSKGARKTASLVLYDQGGEEAARWNFSGVMATSYTASGVAADSTGLFTEKVELSHEGFERVK